MNGLIRPYRTALGISILAVVLIAALIISGCSPAGVATPVSSARSSPSWQVYFSPQGGATSAVVNALRGAKRSVLVQAYSFTSAPIARALLDAKKRGVNVQVILDDSNVTAKYSAADFLRNTGVPTWIDSAHAIAHSKVMIIDGKRVITGSFNFTKAAEYNNAENLLVIDDAALASRYTEDWQKHKRHSRPYTGKEPAEKKRRSRSYNRSRD